jgi:8-oxo-dGTP pyrophosphatase MutT (NUDIX family)
VSVCIIFRKNKNNTEVLLVKREDNNKWCIPGGHLENKEKSLDAAIREIKEETNLNLNKKNLFLVDQIDDEKINNDNNVHLYFYNLIVTQEIHTYLLNEIYSYFINIEKVLLEHIIMIVDYRVICNMTLRLFYFNFRNSYYYPSIEKSTYKLPIPITDTFGNNDSKIATYDNIKKYLIYSIITTDKKVHEPLSPYYDIIKNKKILFNCKIIHP